MPRTLPAGMLLAVWAVLLVSMIVSGQQPARPEPWAFGMYARLFFLAFLGLHVWALWLLMEGEA